MMISYISNFQILIKPESVLALASILGNFLFSIKVFPGRIKEACNCFTI